MSDIPIPILKDTKDPHYRYKMPKLTAKVEGSGNGIKTVITNMASIARALGRPPSYPTKYFGCELGAQVTMNQDLFVVNGSHDPEKLLNLLYAFIRKFVLCAKCNNPETSLIVSNQIKQKCIACGHEAIIPKTLHKLTTYIINHPPDGSNPTLSGVSASKAVGKEKGKGKSANGNFYKFVQTVNLLIPDRDYTVSVTKIFVQNSHHP
jgi:translation initiation factor 5